MNNIVLFEPEIPQNTGNIIRTCAATNCRLHLIKPLGFKFDDNSIKRYSIHYIDDIEYYLYDDINDFFEKNKGNYYFLTRYGKKTYSNFEIKEGNNYFIFGKESTGIPYDILKNNLDNCYRIPISNKVRSLNLSNTVAIVIFSYLEKIGFNGLSLFEPEEFKGKNFLG